MNIVPGEGRGLFERKEDADEESRYVVLLKKTDSAGDYEDFNIGMLCCVTEGAEIKVGERMWIAPLSRIEYAKEPETE